MLGATPCGLRCSAGGVGRGAGRGALLWGWLEFISSPVCSASLVLVHRFAPAVWRWHGKWGLFFSWAGSVESLTICCDSCCMHLNRFFSLSCLSSLASQKL